jgi:hypothetical protein
MARFCPARQSWPPCDHAGTGGPTVPRMSEPSGIAALSALRPAMKCPKCGWITSWDTLYSASAVMTARSRYESYPRLARDPGSRCLPQAATHEVFALESGPPSPSRSLVCVRSPLWLTCSASALSRLCSVRSDGTTDHTNDGPHYGPFWLIIVVPVGGGLLLISGILYILSQLSRPRPKR